jgi:ATP-binding cassette subfamily B protein
MAWLTKLVLDSLTGDTLISRRQLLFQAVALALGGAVALVVPHLLQLWQHEIERRTSTLAQDELYQAVERLGGLARFESPTFLDRLRMATQAADQTASGAISGSVMMLGAALTSLGFLVSLVLLAPIMALVLLAAAGTALIAELALNRGRERMLVQIGPIERRHFFYSQLLGTVAAAKEIRLFGVGPFLRSRMLRERLVSNGARRDMDLRELRTQSALGLLGAAVCGGGLLWCVVAARAGDLSAGDVALFIAAVGGVQAALTQLVRQYAVTHHVLLLFAHYASIVDGESDLPVVNPPRTLGSLSSGIELVDVWFRYSADHPWALQAVNLTIPAGQIVAVVGRNGGGKSTIVKLLCRFYDPTYGKILWDGTDLREVAPEDLRARIGAVFQDYMEYDLTAADVIGLGDLTARQDLSRIEGAARLAGIHEDLVQLPYGYDTLLTRLWSTESDKDDPMTGIVPSGGQWQRLALARGFLRDKRDLMILDEPSAGLDAEAENAIHVGLATQRRGRTSVLISHRLSAVRDADLIVVLERGRIIERGVHNELLSREGTYARLFSLQARGYGSGEDPACGEVPPRVGGLA